MDYCFKTNDISREHVPTPIQTIQKNKIIEESEHASKAVLYLDDEKKHRKVVSSFDKNFINLLMEEEWVGKKVEFIDGQVIP